jgi:tetratricopeptide (TPR) repeat protein
MIRREMSRAPAGGKVGRAIQRDLRKGRYLLAVSRLEKILSAEVQDPEPQDVLRDIFHQVTSGIEDERQQELVGALLAFRLTGLNLILLALNNGMADRALEWAHDFLQRFPEDPGGLTLLSLGYEFRGDYDQALTVCSRLIEVKPQDPESYWRRAAVYDAKGNEAVAADRRDEAEDAYHLAIADYDILTTLAPKACLAFLERGRVHLKMDDSEEARTSFSNAIECDPNLTDAYLMRASLSESVGYYDQALDDYGHAVRLAPKVKEIYLARARVGIAMGRWSDAEKDLAAALKLDSAYVEAYYERGFLRETTGDLAAALRDFGEVVSRMPEDPQGYLARGEVLSLLGKGEQAVADFTKALEFEGSKLLAYLGRAQAQLNLGDRQMEVSSDAEARLSYERGLADAETALRLDPENPSAHWYHGLILRTLDGYDWAVEAFRNLLRLAPEDQEFRARVLAERGEAFRLWGELLRETHALRSAVNDYREAISVGGDSPELWWAFSGLGAALSGLEVYREAQIAFDEAMRLDPTNVWAQVGLGRILLLQGQYERAEKQFARAVEASAAAGQDVAWPCVGRGLALERMGSIDKAAEVYAQALGAKADARAYVARGALFEDFEIPEAVPHAEEDYRAAINAEALFGDAYNSLAWLFAVKSPTEAHLREAFTLAGRAVELAPRGPEVGFALDTLGWIEYRLRRYKEAVLRLQDAHKLAPYRIIRRVHLKAAREKAAHM